MSSLLQWFTSPEWAQVVKALLHSLWQGALIAVVLAIFLRRVSNPVARYRSALAALASIVIATVVTWAIINAPTHRLAPSRQLPLVVTQPSAPDPVATPEPHSIPETVVIMRHKTAEVRWTAWLAFAWLAGAVLMLARAGLKVAGAEQLRRSCRALNDIRVEALLAETRRALGIANRIRVGVTDKLTSPAVVGIVVPMLILPLSLLTTLTPEQIRFILLHELAHIRRRDYLANLFQFVAESLLFFNPAVWWISNQIRREREACCDALAIELSGAPADYAKTLVHVAEQVLYPAPAAALAFGNKREPSTLTERIQRLLVPGYRPSLRLTWRAMLAALIFGGVLLFLSAIGTRFTVAAVLEPRSLNKWLSVTAHLRTADGSAMPESNYVAILARTKEGAGLYGADARPDGTVKASSERGTLWVAAEADGFGPTVVGPLNGNGKNLLDAGELILNRGFDVPIQINDSNTGTSVTNATLRIDFWWPGRSDNGYEVLQSRYLKTDSGGQARLAHCANLSLNITVNAPGYEISEYRFKSLRAGKTLNIHANSGAHISGMVTDQTTSQVIAGATVRLICEKSREAEYHYEWKDPERVLAVTGADGHFFANQLRQGMSYDLGVSALGHEPVIVSNLVSDDVKPDQRIRPLTIQLKPSRRIAGRLIEAGTTNVIPGAKIRVSFNENLLTAYTDSEGRFEFTELVSGNYTLYVEGGDPTTSQQTYRPDIDTNITLAVKLYPSSTLKPVPTSSTSTTNDPTSETPASVKSTHDEQIQITQLVQDGKLMFQLGKMDEAEAKLNEALKRDPHIQAALYYLNLVKQTRAKQEMDARNLNSRGHNLPNADVNARGNIVYTSLERQKVYKKLNNITFDRIAFLDLPLSEVVRELSEQTQLRDTDKEGINFIISNDVDLGDVRISLDPGLKNVRLMDVLEAIVKTADHPIKYSILDYGIEFSLKGPETPELFTRTFRVDPNTFFMGLQNVGGLNFGTSNSLPRVNHPGSTAQASTDSTARKHVVAEIQRAVINFFADVGVSLAPPKSVFYNDRQSTLTVHATSDDLDLIEAAVDTLNIAPPEVTVRARFVQLRPGSDWLQKLLHPNTAATNDQPTILAILTDPQFRVVLNALEKREGADLLNEGQVTTLSGGQAQFQVLEADTVDDVTNSTSSISNGVSSASTKFDPEHNPVGTTLDVIPYVCADGSTIQMTLIPTVIEPVRDDQPGDSTTTIAKMTGNVPITGIVPQPHVRVWQATTSSILWDGQTVVFGGLQNQTGNTPINTNLLIFITPTLIDPAGNRIHSDDYYDGGPGFPGSGGGGFGGGGFGGGRN